MPYELDASIASPKRSGRNYCAWDFANTLLFYCAGAGIQAQLFGLPAQVLACTFLHSFDLGTRLDVERQREDPFIDVFEALVIDANDDLLHPLLQQLNDDVIQRDIGLG